MSESKVVRAFGLLGALVTASVLAMGCSAPPDGQTGGTAPEVKDQGTSPEGVSSGSNVITVWATAPLPKYCTIPSALAPPLLPAHYVEKIPNNWARRPNGTDYVYAPNPHTGVGGTPANPSWIFADGYTIPFPTPWVWAGSGSPDPGTYESNLWNIPSTLWWQYLVHDVQPNADARTYSEDIGHAFFMVPVPAIGDYDRAYNLAAANTGYPVEARVTKCVRVVTRSGSILTDTGDSFLVFDEHDPRGPPY